MIKKFFKWAAVSVAALIAVFIVAGIVAAFTGGEMDSPEPAAGIETTEEESDMSKITISESGNDLLAEFEVRENVTTSMTASGARRDAQAALRAIREDHSDYERAIIRATFPEGGYDGMILNASYDKATVDKLELDNLTAADDVLSLRDGGSAHPDLLK